MNCSAEKASRKWAIGAFGRTRTAMVTVAALALLGMQVASAAAARRPVPAPWDALFGFGGGPPKRRATVHHAAVPLPKPRPAEAPKAESDKAESDKAESGKPEADKAESAKPGSDQPAEKTAPAMTGKPAQQAAPAAPEPSACRLALTDQIAIAPSIPDIHGAGGCGGEDLVRLEAIVMQDKQRVSVKPAAILRCKMATAVAEWVRSDIAPLAQSLGSRISDLDNFDSFECRGRNRVVGAPLSEHGRANALDVRAFGLANGKSILLTDRTVPRDLRETVLHSVCARFSTVLGPGSDWYHEDHIHLDLMERHNNYRICQWNVYDPLPQVAPLLPAKRPEEAPPREVAAKSDAAKSETGTKPDTSKSEEAEPNAAEASPAKPEPRKPQPTKKRRQNRRL